MANGVGPRRRGPKVAAAWRYDGPLSVLRLPLDVSDPQSRRQLERVFATAFSVRRAVQRDARARLAAFRAAIHERAAVGAAAVRDRVGLTPAGLQYAAYRHVDAAAHVRRYLTKAMAMHLADGVWQAVDRHLFPDRTGRPDPASATQPGRPLQAYHRDHTSNSYRQLRTAAAMDGAARTLAGRTRARVIAAGLVAVHGANLTAETADLRVWARRWGRGIHAFTPGMLLTALTHEATKVTATATVSTSGSIGAGGGGLMRAGTRHTAWSQHCLCGARVPKPLRQRRHTCPTCGLTGDRDLTAALLGAHTVLDDPNQPNTARIDWPHAHATHTTLGVTAINEGLQGALTESTGHHRPHPHPTGAGARRPQRSTNHPVRGGRCRRARRNTGQAPPTTPDQTHTPPPCGTTPERRDAHPGLRQHQGTKPRH
ncbi:transposase [Dactylosporangium sp. NBC_01737]|uniref:hypothetical protein n=1 Tax=Dactylosporangium sp. NBC_01737 TaxID=2975959 RepID=UPI002E15051F|nr:transposase [Dactylosporangium sp. NBC_01737]